MLKVSHGKVVKVSRTDAKAAQLAAKRQRSENRYADGIAQKYSKGELAFAATSMRDNDDSESGLRGRIARAVLIGGVGTYTYASVAKAADIDVSDVTRARLRYIANNVRFRADLVGFAIEPDFADNEVTVRYATSDEKAASLRLARSFGLGRVTAYVPTKAASKARKADDKPLPTIDEMLGSDAA